MAKNTKTAGQTATKINEFQDMLNKASGCVVTVTTLTDDAGTLSSDVANIVKTYKASSWEFAKVCYYFNKVKGVDVKTLAGLMDVSFQNINKHANNVAFLLKTYGQGFDEIADTYSISKVDLYRKAKDAGCYKKDKFEDVINKKRSDIEKAIAKKSGTGNDNADKPADTVLIRMIDPDGNEIARPVEKSVWAEWLKEDKAE